ncbi:hypothetical protein [Sphaerisporangium rhizosphaerae]|uniref:Uncharacterized protein n=1 Tax=Sphaerisporangium rhizosphaerae TaxID=2269375 RepID=A0ABW2P3V3_9ACTN
MDPIVLAAGTALVTAMATDAWEQARKAAVALWRRTRPDEADSVAGELAEVRAQVIAARREGDAETERALAGSWQIRLQRLLRADPDLAAELRRVLAEELSPAATGDGASRAATVTMDATANDHGRVYQAARDQHITES